MTPTIHAMLLSALHGAFVGALSAMWIDYRVFRQWKKWSDATTYDWSTATFRWMHGAVVGAITGAGYGWT